LKHELRTIIVKQSKTTGVKLLEASKIKDLIQEAYSCELEDDEWDDDLMDLGVIDSLRAMELIVKMEKEFNIKFSYADYTQVGFFTVNKIRDSIEKYIN